MDKQKTKFVVSETATSTFNYHLRLVGPEAIRVDGLVGIALCGVTVGWDTQIPIEAWGRASGDLPSKWCKTCFATFQKAAMDAIAQNSIPKMGDIVFYRTVRKTLNPTQSLEIGFKGTGFGVMLGIVPQGAPEPPAIALPRLIGEIGYLRFDDVIDFFGEKVGAECVEKFKDKYYGKVVATDPTNGETETEGLALKSALHLVDSSGKSIQVLPGPKGKQ
jgi:hypothetical protein